MSAKESAYSTQNRESPKVHLLAGRKISEDDIAQRSVDLPLAVVERCAYLRTRMKPPPAHGDTITIELPDVEPAALKLYAWWLRSGDAPLFLHDETGPVAQPHHTLVWRDCFDLIQAHVLGSRLEDPDFQHYILDQLNRWLAPQQEPDLELLDYLWGIEMGQVGDALLCFVLGHMFQMELQRARILVGWMKGLLGERRKMDYIESIKKYGTSVATKKSPRTAEASTEDKPVRTDEVEAIPIPMLASPAAAQRPSASGPMSHSNTPTTLCLKPSSIIQEARGASKGDTEGQASTPTKRRSQSKRKVLGLSDLTPSFLRKEPQHLLPSLRIHPKALASITNTNMLTGMEMKGTSSLRIPLQLSLHPSIRHGLAGAPTPPRLKKLELNQQGESAELRGGAQGAPSTGISASMPAIADESLQLLDFWTDPDDAPGPDFFNIPVEVARPPIAPSSPPRTSRTPRTPTPTTKQIVQSFRLTRTPTPRRRSTRSWSVSSIRSIENDKPTHKKSVIDRPGRGLISRKPVPQTGVEFLRNYADGEMLQRMISVNSRPIELGPAAAGTRRQDGDEVWDWDVPSRRPGTA
ncbi:hypothetical protein BU23DRAFT_571019 [Bimuria novae-zelandiae CBS 107.79]|uniref:Uncharacterized protein n=1 Tax=Bimuria novae-zelandiae CBS 107.79 TaxID=1447943 RepID=A0A6A5UZI4_9PLEO|nr:hypothetical protein BU23DRAFT_571019 [Bimuria novae-zelandiae CBS 107.79]